MMPSSMNMHLSNLPDWRRVWIRQHAVRGTRQRVRPRTSSPRAQIALSAAAERRTSSEDSSYGICCLRRNARRGMRCPAGMARRPVPTTLRQRRFIVVINPTEAWTH
jgi:hypothetical protein